ncbi:bacteriophage abortive infection AbiH family protein [Priestia endophytica]|uniref:Bacteriophage abortive infection AbiH n=1 Tax=Priestia endophytica DSM 13796 TaxID=1121089 RepID=A0A1I6C0A5_9BACI|nr:bacteriophage abortive infection AbiH family protein [Priestia endophytica]KYG33443.1 hypothetical protein AZF06_21605 [Priestia endophytica]SFQ86616.1 Bacteriophage abortive infection AbiH [Priestia endophytica DSM 13796]
MSNLFIIGNGFDLSHGLPTSYQNFHQYLLDKYPNSIHKGASFSIEPTTLPDGGISFDDDELVGFILELISIAEKDGDNWCDIERSLGLLDFDTYFDDMNSLFEHDDHDNALFRDAHRNEGVSSNFYFAMIEVKRLFSEWVNSIDTSMVSGKDCLYKLIDEDEDTFLTFNYTDVLERVYEAIDITYIHGSQGGEIIIGHEEPYRESLDRYTGAEHDLMNLHDALRKDTKAIIEKERDFFDSLQNIDRIYSYGFSFSKVDLPYIKEICNHIDTKKITWYLNDYDSKERICTFINAILECGFKGKFATFHVE